ncbi:hypothetical protein [Vibrio sp. 10N.261.55.A7]|uniref:hypothetical protein n=1 Tax=Vibrio sp. 10N.261.55.A7 TaxID=1880851 RepID=UPI001A7E103C|nr:hypothetical protein [Vibrio sp. 10N.261.55.A7]
MSIILFTASLAFASTAFANSGTSQSGPLIDCQLESGKVERVTSLMCDLNDGKRV